NGASLEIGSPLGEGDYSASYNVGLLFGGRAQAFAGSDQTLKTANLGMNLPFGNGVDLTLGLFDTTVGYEVEASASNPNVMRSYGYAQEPLTHTGLMAATEITEGLSVSLAIVDGFDDNVAQTGDSSGHSDFGYVLGAELTVPDSLGFLGGSSLYVGYVDGKDAGNFGLFPTGAADADGNPIQAPNVENELLYIGASVNTPIEGVAIGIAYDDRQWGNHFDSDSVALYATYSLSEDASLSVRYDNGTAEFGGAEDSFENLALTLDYSIWENVLTRFEMGWESGIGALGLNAVTSGARPSTNADGGVYDGHGNSSYFALNAFYSF
ncbi:MAG: porin, partial [Pedosphaera sp.]|nr:porin [Pedosphaera sp.]